MTSYKKKLAKLSESKFEFDTFESSDDSLVIQQFLNAYTFIEFVFSKQGELISENTIDCYPTP